MNRRPGQIKVTIETGYCSFCDRTRNLRREERHLGALVRTIVACESCHRTLSSTIGVAGAETPAAEEAASAGAAVEAAPNLEPAPEARSSGQGFLHSELDPPRVAAFQIAVTRHRPQREEFRIAVVA